MRRRFSALSTSARENQRDTWVRRRARGRQRERTNRRVQRRQAREEIRDARESARALRETSRTRYRRAWKKQACFRPLDGWAVKLKRQAGEKKKRRATEEMDGRDGREGRLTRPSHFSLLLGFNF